MKSNKKFVILLEIFVITFLVISVVPVCGLSVSSADISAYPSIVNPGDEITVTFFGAPGFELDWIAMYKVGEQDIYEQGEFGGVVYFLEGEKSGTLIFTAPNEPGDYDFRLFGDDGYTDIARSNIVKVQEGTPPTSEEATILFEANFDDGYAPGFGNEVGDWEVHLLYQYTGKYTATTDTYRFSMAGDTNWQDYVIDADFFNALDGGLLVRAQDQDNCIALIVRPASNEIGWNVRKGGSWGATGLEVATLGHEPGKELHVKVEVAGSEFKAYVNGVLKTTLNTTEHPNGKIGLYLGKQSDQYWDNVVVYSSGAAGSTPTTLPPTAEAGLVAYYTFDGDTLDHSENENNGTIHGATFVAGYKGQALSFDGKDDYVQVPDSPSLDIARNNISLSTWVYFPEFVPDYGTVIEKTGSGGWNRYGVFSKNGKLSFLLYTESIEAHTAVSANQWVHFVATYDGINMKIYINGALDVEREQPGIDIKENNMPLMIGADPFGDGHYGHILIDEVKIYNYALSADEIKALYDGKEPSAPSSTPTTTPVIPGTGEESPLPLEELQFDFNDGRAQNWLDDGSGCWAVSDGAYVMTGNNGGVWRYSYYDQKFCDFEFQVDMRKLSGDSSENNYSYGVSFRSDGTMDNRDSFTISKGGGYGIGKSVNGTSTKIKDWTKSVARNAGFEHWNTLGVVAKGSSLRFYANGILLHDIQDTAFSCGLVGLHAYDPAKPIARTQCNLIILLFYRVL